jgi:galactose mutarotase-like enzyme
VNARITPASWGAWPAVRLEDDVVALLLVPGLGARVVSLVDRRSGREWLVQGEPPGSREAAGWAAEDVVFDGRTSFGWDECLPTVAPCPDPLDASAPPLRDHGDQWGRPAGPGDHDGPASLVHAFASPRWPYAFERRISLPGAGGVLAEYRLTSQAEETLPILWSMHPVFLLEPGTRIDLGEVSEARLTSSIGLPFGPADRVGWPVAGTDAGEGIDLSRVRGPEGWAAKLYARAPDQVRAVTPDGASLELRWDRAFAPTVGIWISAGGWPVGGPPAQQVALEPTTSPDDDLGDAMAHGRSVMLGPGEVRTWSVRLDLRAPA